MESVVDDTSRQPTRRPYVPPVLIRYGTVGELTLGMNGSASDQQRPTKG